MKNTKGIFQVAGNTHVRRLRGQKPWGEGLVYGGFTLCGW